MTKAAALTEYSANILEIDKRIEKCLGDIEIILKEDFASERPKHDFLQWRLQYDAAVIEIESSDMTSALRSILEEIHERGDTVESIEGAVLPLVDYVKSVISMPPLDSYPASCPFCPNYKPPDAPEQESLQFLSAIGQHIEADLLRACLPAKCDVSQDEHCSYFDYRQKLALLRSLYDAEHISELHWKLREKQLASFECSCCGDQCLFCFLETCAKYLALDMALVDSGLFQPLQVCDKQLHTLYNKCVLDFIEILLDDKLEEDHLVENRNTFRCRLREKLLGVDSVPQLADEGITQILQDMNWFDSRLKYYLAKYAYGDTHISVDTNWVSQSVRNLVSSLETLIPGVTSAWQQWSSILVEQERFKTVPCSMDGSERTVQIFGPAWEFLLHLQRFSAIVGKSNGKSLIVSLNHFLHTGIDVITTTCNAIAKRDDIDEKTYVAYNSVAYVRSQLEAFQNKNGDVADLPAGVVQKLYTVEDSLEYHLVCHHIKWASSPARHSLYDFSSIQKPDTDGFTLAPASLHMYVESMCQQLSEVLCQVGCRKVVARVWSELSTMLCATYVQARASEQQVGLLSRDIDVVLGTSFNVLLFVSDGVDEVIGLLEDNGDLRKIRHIKNIHACCVLLLSTRYLNDAPVEVLYQTFKGGFLSEGKLLPGLFWVSHLFQNSLSGASFKVDSAPNILVWIMLEMMRVQKNFNFVLCVKAMRSFNHMLSILLVRQGCTGGHLSEDEQTRLMDCALSLGTARPACEVSHSFVGDMLIPIVEKTNSWQVFGSDSLNANRPWWYRVLQQRFKNSYGKSIFLSICDLTMARSRSVNDSNRWKSTQEKLRGFVGEKVDEESEAVSEADRILQHMIDHLGLVSRDILACFVAMDDRKTDNVNPVLGSIGLQFLLNTVCDFLKDPEFLHEVYGVSNAAIEENCRRLCEVLQEGVFGEGKGRETAKSIRGKLKVIKSVINRSRDLLPPASVTGQSTYTEFLELPLTAFDHQIWAQSTSEQDTAKLNTVREVLKCNDRWFRKNLGVEQLVTFAQPGLTGDREVTLKVSCSNENQPQNLSVDPLRSYSLWKAGCAERFDSLKGLNPQISSIADVLSEFNFCTILRHHPGLNAKDENEEAKESKVLRSLFQLSKIPDDEHWQKLTSF